jgi:hypothetical protein
VSQKQATVIGAQAAAGYSAEFVLAGDLHLDGTVYKVGSPKVADQAKDCNIRHTASTAARFMVRSF